MKQAHETVASYEYAFRRHVGAGPVAKYDNGALAAASLLAWPDAFNTRDKPAAADAPVNDVGGRFAAGYAAAFEREARQT